LGIVNPLSNQFDQLPQFEQAERIQDGRSWQHGGVRRGRGVIGPLARQGDCSVTLIEERKDFAAADSARLQDPKPFS
jgi:hypothetical protein